MNPVKKGSFVVLEGIEGCGKSTNLNFICDWLKSHSLPYCQTREPGGTELAEKIRNLLLPCYLEPVHETTELMLFFAARNQHIQQVIQPAMIEGKIVICDRFTDATYAYQGAGRGIEEARIEALETVVQGDFRPDLTLLLDVPVALSQQRVKEQGKPDRIEQEQKEFFERVRQNYIDRALAHQDRYVIIDAHKPLDIVQKDIEQILAKRFLH